MDHLKNKIKKSQLSSDSQFWNFILIATFSQPQGTNLKSVIMYFSIKKWAMVCSLAMMLLFVGCCGEEDPVNTEPPVNTALNLDSLYVDSLIGTLPPLASSVPYNFDSFPLPAKFQMLSNRQTAGPATMDTRYYNQPFVQFYDDDMLHATSDSLQVYFPIQSGTKIDSVRAKYELRHGKREFAYVLRIFLDKPSTAAGTMVGVVTAKTDSSQIYNVVTAYSVIIYDSNKDQTGKKVIDADIDGAPSILDSLSTNPN